MKRSRTVWIDGTLIPSEQAVVSAHDRAFRSGEGVFETFRSYGTFVFRLREHLERAIFGASVLGFELSSMDVLAAGVQSAVDANVTSQATAAVRMVATPGDIDPDSPFPGAPVGLPRVVITVHDLVLDPTLRTDGATAIVVPWGREVAHVKAVSYLASSLARRQARASGAHEGLLTDDAGHVLEASGANVFAIIDGTVVTPPINGTILPGVTRSVVIEVAQELSMRVDQRALGLDELHGADEALLTATTREVVPLVRIGERAIGSGRPGPMTAALADGFSRLVQREAQRAQG